MTLGRTFPVLRALLCFSREAPRLLVERPFLAFSIEVSLVLCCCLWFGVCRILAFFFGLLRFFRLLTGQGRLCMCQAVLLRQNLWVHLCFAVMALRKLRLLQKSKRADSNIALSNRTSVVPLAVVANQNEA